MATSRQEAKANGLARYFTGQPCPHGHIAERYTSGSCAECALARQRAPAAVAYHKIRAQTPKYRAARRTPEALSATRTRNQKPSVKAAAKERQWRRNGLPEPLRP